MEKQIMNTKLNKVTRNTLVSAALIFSVMAGSVGFVAAQENDADSAEGNASKQEDGRRDGRRGGRSFGGQRGGGGFSAIA